MSTVRHRFEVGIQRLYYVLWGIGSPLYVFMVISETEDTHLKTHWELQLLWVGLFSMAVIVPWVGMRLVRWVYRGFFPKE